MRKLDLKNYTYSVKDQQGVTRLLPYQFKDVLVNVITHTSLGLNGPELLDINEVAEKIEKANMEVILTDVDYHKIIDNLKRFRGFSKVDIQFLKRIYDCPEIPDDGMQVIKFSEN
jgi:hypothetical protein